MIRLPVDRSRSVAVILAACFTLSAALSAAADGWPPPGEPVRVKISRDAWLSAVGQGRDGSNSGSPILRIKSCQDFVVLDADLSALRGRLVTGALLHVHSAAADAPLMRVTVSTLATEWVEGTTSNYESQAGAACFHQAALGTRDWAFPGGTLMDAAFGRGGTAWWFADATPPDADRWQAVAVDPDVIAARIAGLSAGFALQDDVGSEWSCIDGQYKRRVMPNRYFHSRESGRTGPWLEIWLDGTDRQPPEAVGGITATSDGLPAAEAMVTWTTPADSGGGHTLGFQVAAACAGKAVPIPRYLVPMAAKAGEPVRMRLQDLPLEPGAELSLSIAAVDSAGNVGPAGRHTVRLAGATAPVKISASDIEPFAGAGEPPTVGGLKVAVLDLLDKVRPTDGQMIPAHDAAYRTANHLWSAAKKLVRLQAARNEAVCFQVNLEGAAEKVSMKLDFPEADGLRTKLYRFDYVGTKAGPMPDALVPQDGPFAVPFAGDPQAAGATNGSLLCEVYVPHNVAAGARRGTLTISAGDQSLQIAVELTVWSFTLPNKLSFVPEMNTYGTAGPEGLGREYYRLAHEHRTCLNRLYYHWSGKLDFGPPVEGGRVDWGPWAKQFGPLLDGSAFADLPRAGEPVDVFYLPFNENWPVDIFAAYHKSYWPEDAFAPSYRPALQAALADFAKLADRRGWHDTILEFFLNSKVYYKEKRGWLNVSAPWCFDEPHATQDFWALRWYGRLFHEAVDPVRGKAKVWFRADVSMGQFGRQILAGVTDLEILGGFNREKARMKQQDWQIAPQHVGVYGSANDPAASNLHEVLWCHSAWRDGCVGVVPWQTIATEDAWNTGEQTGLFYERDGKLFASVRLKAFRRGQQDVEYLTWLAALGGRPHAAVAAGVQGVLDLSTREAAANVDATALWRLRARVGQMLSAAKPPYRRALVDLPTPPRDMAALPALGYARVAPKVAPATPQ